MRKALLLHASHTQSPLHWGDLVAELGADRNSESGARPHFTRCSLRCSQSTPTPPRKPPRERKERAWLIATDPRQWWVGLLEVNHRTPRGLPLFSRS